MLETDSSNPQDTAVGNTKQQTTKHKHMGHRENLQKHLRWFSTYWPYHNVLTALTLPQLQQFRTGLVQRIAVDRQKGRPANPQYQQVLTQVDQRLQLLQQQQAQEDILRQVDVRLQQFPNPEAMFRQIDQRLQQLTAQNIETQQQIQNQYEDIIRHLDQHLERLNPHHTQVQNQLLEMQDQILQRFEQLAAQFETGSVEDDEVSSISTAISYTSSEANEESATQVLVVSQVILQGGMLLTQRLDELIAQLQQQTQQSSLQSNQSGTNPQEVQTSGTLIERSRRAIEQQIEDLQQRVSDIIESFDNQTSRVVVTYFARQMFHYLFSTIRQRFIQYFFNR